MIIGEMRIIIVAYILSVLFCEYFGSTLTLAENRLECYGCGHSHSRSVDVGGANDTNCYQLLPKDNEFPKRGDPAVDYVHKCPRKDDTYCRADVTYLNNVVAAIVRGCASSCNPEARKCTFTSYGVTKQTCSSCCAGGNNCNKWNDICFFTAGMVIRNDEDNYDIGYGKCREKNLKKRSAQREDF